MSTPMTTAVSRMTDHAAPADWIAQVQLDPGENKGRPDILQVIRLDPRDRDYDTQVATYVGSLLNHVFEFGRRIGMPVASGLVQTDMNNRDPDAVRTVSGAFSLPRARTHGLEKNLDRFEDQINAAAARLKPGQSVALRDYWDAQILSKDYKIRGGDSPEHYYALGSFTVRSEANLVISKGADGRVRVSGAVKSYVIDRYDFNNPLVATDRGTNQRIELTARDFARFEQLGMARPFDVRSSPLTSTAVVDGNGRMAWRTVDENGKPLSGATSTPRPRAGGRIDG